MCGSGKRVYPNGAAAMREARWLQQSNRGTSMLRPYRCPACSQWHLANSKGGRGPAYLTEFKRRKQRLKEGDGTWQE
jgi:hypothetical protein